MPRKLLSRLPRALSRRSKTPAASAAREERTLDVVAHDDPTIRDARRVANRPDGGDAFVRDPLAEGHPGLDADDAEAFAEEFVATATTAEPVDEDARDEVVVEEQGGPFVALDDDTEVSDEDVDVDVAEVAMLPEELAVGEEPGPDEGDDREREGRSTRRIRGRRPPAR